MSELYPKHITLGKRTASLLRCIFVQPERYIHFLCP